MEDFLDVSKMKSHTIIIGSVAVLGLIGLLWQARPNGAGRPAKMANEAPARKIAVLGPSDGERHGERDDVSGAGDGAEPEAGDASDMASTDVPQSLPTPNEDLLVPRPEPSWDPHDDARSRRDIGRAAEALIARSIDRLEAEYSAAQAAGDHAAARRKRIRIERLQKRHQQISQDDVDGASP